MSLNMPQVEKPGPKMVQVRVETPNQLAKALEVLEGMGYEVSGSMYRLIILRTTYLRNTELGQVVWSEEPKKHCEDITWMIPTEEEGKTEITKKWHIPDRRHWAEFQEYILSQGNAWGSGRKDVEPNRGPCYYLTNGVLTWDGDFEAYKSYPAEEQQWKPRNPSHRHHKLMAKFAEDAAVSDTPWRFGNVAWEAEVLGRWVKMDSCPEWEPEHKYRRRLDLKVGDVTSKGMIVAETENSYVLLNGGRETLIGKEEME